MNKLELSANKSSLLLAKHYMESSRPQSINKCVTASGYVCKHNTTMTYE